MTDEMFEAWNRAAWDAWERDGHYEKDCEGWSGASDGMIICACGIEVAAPSLITVSGEDINGAVATPAANAIARAGRRAFPDAWFVRASSGVLVVTDRDGERQWTLDFEPAAALAASLDGKRIQAFSFILPAKADYVTARPRTTASGARRIPAAGRGAAA